MPKYLLVHLFAFAAGSSAALASNHILYECVDAGGNKQFTNIPANPKACKALNIPTTPPPTASAPAAPAQAKSPARAPATATPANFPRVDAQTQNQRDNDRRRILDNELGAEQRLLDQARRELAEQEAVRHGTERNYQRVLDRLEPFKKKVKLHEDNVANIRREMGNMR